MRAFLVALCCTVAAPLWAGDIQGMVTAALRPTPIANARVVLRSGASEWTALTDDRGAFRFSLEAGEAGLTVEVTSDGFAPYRRAISEVPLDAGILVVRLEFANVHESIVVDGRIVGLESSAPGVSHSVSGTELTELPASRQYLTKFALLDPHVRQVVGLGGDGNNNSRLSVNAGSYRHTSYLLDGQINYDWIYANGPYQPVPVSATEELRVVTNPNSAQYGTSTTGSVRITTKSGTNDPHGEMFTWAKPSAIQAAPPLSTFAVPNEREQWGALLSGPVRRNRTFFLADYEGIRQVRGSYIQSPTPSFFTGETREHYALARFDEIVSEEHTLSLRLNGHHYSNTNANDRVGGYVQASAGRVERTQSWGGQLADRWLLGGVLNELRINYVSYFPDSASPLQPSVGVVRPSYSTEGYSTTNWVHARTTDISDSFAFRRGRHSFQAGVEVVHVGVRDFSHTPLGTYTFAAGAPTAGESPLSYTQTFGTANITYGATHLASFVQDDVRLSRRLSANLGLRYEYQSVTDGVRNLAPRAGLAWDASADGKTVVRAGAAILYDQLYLYIHRRFQLAGPNSPQIAESVSRGAAGFPTFPNSLTLPPLALQSVSRNLYLPSPSLANPYSLQFSLGLERRIDRGFVLSLNGVHNHTLRQYRVNDINHPAPFLRTAAGQSRSGSAADLTRPYSTYLGLPVRDVAVIENSASSLYAALDIGVRRAVGKRYQMQAHYVISSSARHPRCSTPTPTAACRTSGTTGDRRSARRAISSSTTASSPAAQPRSGRESVSPASSRPRRECP